jgi:hypothetical protein
MSTGGSDETGGDYDDDNDSAVIIIVRVSEGVTRKIVNSTYNQQ